VAAAEPVQFLPQRPVGLAEVADLRAQPRRLLRRGAPRLVELPLQLGPAGFLVLQTPAQLLDGALRLGPLRGEHALQGGRLVPRPRELRARRLQGRSVRRGHFPRPSELRDRFGELGPDPFDLRGGLRRRPPRPFELRAGAGELRQRRPRLLELHARFQHLRADPLEIGPRSRGVQTRAVGLGAGRRELFLQRLEQPVPLGLTGAQRVDRPFAFRQEGAQLLFPADPPGDFRGSHLRRPGADGELRAQLVRGPLELHRPQLRLPQRLRAGLELLLQLDLRRRRLLVHSLGLGHRAPVGIPAAVEAAGDHEELRVLLVQPDEPLRGLQRHPLPAAGHEDDLVADRAVRARLRVEEPLRGLRELRGDELLQAQLPRLFRRISGQALGGRIQVGQPARQVEGVHRVLAVTADLEEAVPARLQLSLDPPPTGDLRPQHLRRARQFRGEPAGPALQRVYAIIRRSRRSGPDPFGEPVAVVAEPLGQAGLLPQQLDERLPDRRNGLDGRLGVGLHPEVIGLHIGEKDGEARLPLGAESGPDSLPRARRASGPGEEIERGVQQRPLRRRERLGPRRPQSRARLEQLERRPELLFFRGKRDVEQLEQFRSGDAHPSQIGHVVDRGVRNRAEARQEGLQLLLEPVREGEIEIVAARPAPVGAEDLRLRLHRDQVRREEAEALLDLGPDVRVGGGVGGAARRDRRRLAARGVRAGGAGRRRESLRIGAVRSLLLRILIVFHDLPVPALPQSIGRRRPGGLWTGSALLDGVIGRSEPPPEGRFARAARRRDRAGSRAGTSLRRFIRIPTDPVRLNSFHRWRATPPLWFDPGIRPIREPFEARSIQHHR